MAVTHAVAVTIAVALVRDAVVVEITVRAVKARMASLIVGAVRIVDVGDAIAIPIAVGSATFQIRPVMAPVGARRGRIDRLWPHIHRRRMHVDAR